MGASTDDGVTALFASLEIENSDPHSVEMRLLENSLGLPSPSLQLPFVHCGLGRTAKEFPRQVKNRIALVQRGEITFQEKAVNAMKAGAKACVLYNNRDGNFYGTLGDEATLPTIPVVSISKADGELMQAATGEKNLSQVRLQLNPEEVAQPNHLAEFSSRGPNNDGWIKPELTAPGVNILSATITQAPVPGGGMPDPSGYVSASGTSMATPHVAGACALIRQAHPEWTAMQVKAALVNTAQFMQGQGSIMDQGNGAMDLSRAIDSRAILVTAEDAFSPTHSFGLVVNRGGEVTVSQALTIQNLTAQPDASMYSLRVEFMGTAPEGIKAEMVPGGTKCDKTCVASFDLRITADGTKLVDGAYSGWVVAEADWGALRLPFHYTAARQPAESPGNPGSEESSPIMPPDQKRIRVALTS